MKLKIKNIISDRNFETWVSYQLIYEWEDELSRTLQIPIINNPDRLETNLVNRIRYNLSKRVSYPLIKIMRRILPSSKENKELTVSLYFNLIVSAPIELKKSRMSKIVPVIVDAFIDADFLPEFNKKYADCPLVLISSIETYNYLKSANCPLNIHYWGLSLPDKYKMNPDSIYPKKYDILLAGRQNSCLEQYLEEFIKKNTDKDINIVRSEIQEGQLIFTSNKDGVLGSFNSRDEYMQLLRKARVVFYATPGQDGGEKRTKGYNPVTPKYLESLSAQCKIILRYPDTVETQLYGLPKVSPSIDSYEAFEKQIDLYISQKDNFDRETYTGILNNSYTSVRAQELSDIIKNV